MSVITKDLGIASAYGYAKSKGYTGTEEEFAELMASYADVAQQAEAAAQDAEDAKDAAVSAKNDAQTAQAAAESAQTAAAGSAQTASTKATEASNSAQTAAGSATAAGNSATAASGSAQTAQTAAQTATTKASEASSSASAASTAKTGAETARTGAQTAQTAAETAQANAEAAASSVSASAAQIEQNTEDIAGLKNDLSEFPNGNYPQMGAGYANQLVSGLKKEDQTPYNFRKVPYDATLEDVEKIVGGTIVNNQLISSMGNSRTDNGITVTVSPDKTSASFSGTFTSRPEYGQLALTQTVTLKRDGRKYLFCANQALPLRFGFSGYGPMSVDGSNNQFFIWTRNEGTNWNAYAIMYVPENYEGITLDVSDLAINIFDLTQEFGTAIADYIYSLETATAGAGVAWLKTHFPKQFDAGYQPYDAGTFKSIEGLSGKKTVGFNQWNEVWENGTINGQGQDAIGTAVRPKGYIPVFPNTAYYIPPVMDGIFWYDADKNFISLNYSGGVKTSPNNAHFVRFYTQASYGQTYNHDICINLSDPTKNGTYEPYEAHTYALDSDVVLRGVPKVNEQGKLYYDGDEYLPDGTVNRRFGIVDLGNGDWTKDGSDYFMSASSFAQDMLPKAVSITVKMNAICSKLKVVAQTKFEQENNSISYYSSASNGSLVAYSTDSYADANAFKQAMSGVLLVYELATPTTETADPYTTPQIISPDGTEEYIYEDGAFELPVGHSSDYPVDVSGQLDDILDTPSANGTYVLKATVTDGAVTYSWVADA